MINLAIGFAFLATVVTFWTAFYGTVNSLPFGLQQPMETFMATVNIIRNSMPWFDTVWNVFIIGLTVKVAIFTVTKTWNIIKLVRGGG